MPAINQIYWIALTLIPGMGPITLRKYWALNQSVEHIWHQVESDKCNKDEILDQARAEADRLEQHGVTMLTLDHAEYPQSLKNLSDISPVLYTKGAIGNLQQPAVGIVGSREVSSYGKELTTEIASELSQQAYVIVSGMARGVDTLAHKAALGHSQPTIAVWGSGLDKPYPSENADLAKQIVQNGVIVSQFPLGTEAQPFTFPARNKLIAGFSQAVIVTEARAKSGSLLTAEAARQYGRPVFAMPGSIYSRGSQGPHRLIQQGAHLAIDAADIVSRLRGIMVAPSMARLEMELTQDEEKVISLLRKSPLHIDEIIRQSGQSSSTTNSLLITLEMKGVIRQLDSGEYRKL